MLLKPGTTLMGTSGRGGNVDIHCGRGGSRPYDGAIRFYGIDSNGSHRLAAGMSSSGDWWVTGTVSAVGLSAQTVSGAALVAGDLDVSGTAYIPARGDLSMGTFTNGAAR